LRDPARRSFAISGFSGTAAIRFRVREPAENRRPYWLLGRSAAAAAGRLTGSWTNGRGKTDFIYVNSLFPK
jgi:hypothetical protein